MTGSVESAFSQLFSIGLVWISFHCVGMCGPLLVGLDVGGVARGLAPLHGAASVLAYQAGRALSYGLLGATAGALGAGLAIGLEKAGSVLALVGAGVLFVVVAKRLRGSREQLVQIGSARRQRFLDQSTVRLSRALLDDGQGPLPRAFALGMGMGLLPCMIPLWVLGLAAVTASPLAGAGLMLSLVAMTTPVLLLVTLLPRVARGRLRKSARIAPAVLLALSAIWLLLVGLAGLGVVDHAHVTLRALGEPRVIMLW